MKKGNKVILAFLVAPALPALFFYLYVVLTAPSGDKYTAWFASTYIFVGLFIGYPIVFIIMLPTYFLFEYFKIKNIIFYILFGAGGGALGYYIGWGASLQGAIVPVIWGVLSASTFWFIVRPGKTHIIG